MASDRALADEMMSISRALAERDSELRVRAKALDSALPELKREADAYGDELRVRVEVHYELLLGKVDDLLHTVQSEVREEALRARGVSSRIAALERENAALRSQLETRSSSLEQSTAIAVRERQRSALARGSASLGLPPGSSSRPPARSHQATSDSRVPRWSRGSLCVPSPCSSALLGWFMGWLSAQ